MKRLSVVTSKTSASKNSQTSGKRQRRPANWSGLLTLSLCMGLIVAVLRSESWGIAFHPSAATIVFVGTFIAVVLSSPPSLVMSAFRRLMSLCVKRDSSFLPLAAEIVNCARAIRSKGVGSDEIDGRLEALKDRDLHKGLLLLVDGMQTQQILRILDSDTKLCLETLEQEAALFSMAADYAPTMGVLSAVLGLISSLKTLDDVAATGAGVGNAFLGTGYGLILGNFALLPISVRLEALGRRESMRRRLVRTGVEAISLGLHPRHIEMLLEAFTSGSGELAASAQSCGETAPDLSTVTPPNKKAYSHHA